MNEKSSGVVKWHNIQRGFGLIQGDDGIEYFIWFDDDPQAIEYGLLCNPHVSFFSKPREKGEGLQAFDIEIEKPQLTEGKNSLFSQLVENTALYQQETISNRRWNLWEKVYDEYSEFKEWFDLIGERTNLKQVPTELQVVKRIFYDDIPYGACPKDYSRAEDIEKRMGAYTKFHGKSINLIVHAFYRSAKHDVICWRARAFSRFRGKVFNMRKSWRIRFNYFVSDALDLICKCQEMD